MPRLHWCVLRRPRGGWQWRLSHCFVALVSLRVTASSPAISRLPTVSSRCRPWPFAIVIIIFVVSWLQREPAKKYPFTLDPFQKRSIECLERNESVLVRRHANGCGVLQPDMTGGDHITAPLGSRLHRYSAGLRAHVRRQDGRRRVRDRHGPARQAARHLHVADQGAV